MRTLGVGNRLPSKKKNCKSWGVCLGGGGRGGVLNHELFMMNTVNLCLPDFFSYFTKIWPL